MPVALTLTVLAALTVFGYALGRSRALAMAGGEIRSLHSLPSYHGALIALWCAVPALLLLGLWLIGQPIVVEEIMVAALPAEYRELPAERLGLLINDIGNLAGGGIVAGRPEPAVAAAADHLNRLHGLGNAIQTAAVFALAIAGLAWGRGQIAPKLPARDRVEKALTVVLWISSTIAILTTIGIVLSLLFESIRFFNLVSLTDFLFGLEWSPQTAIREDQVGASGAFGAVPLFTGTLLITVIAMCVAVPVGLMSAVYLTDYAAPKTRTVVKPILEILAGVPTVVYGFFAAITVAPFIREIGGTIGLDVASESALAAGLVMGIMIIPFVSSLSDDVIHAVPQSLRDGALGLGSTKSETIKRMVLPAALPGIVGGVLLAVSRAIGETMIVVMAAGLAANLTANPLEAVTTVTVQIVTLLVGDQEFDSAKTLAAFALGLMLFLITLVLNGIALHVVRKYREQYE